MSTLYLILLIVGVVCFAVDALRLGAKIPVNLTAAGLFFCFMVPVLQRLN